MCLLNVGKSEGPQIIQLFDRGVRLKGKDGSLKRSSSIELPYPSHIGILETLQIYGVQANYMETFRQAIEQEDLPTYTLDLPTIIIEPFPDDLQTITLKEGSDFEDVLNKLEADDQVKTNLNLLPHAEVFDSREQQLSSMTSIPAKTISKQKLDILYWDFIYHSLLEYKIKQKFYNV